MNQEHHQCNLAKASLYHNGERRPWPIQSPGPSCQLLYRWKNPKQRVVFPMREFPDYPHIRTKKPLDLSLAPKQSPPVVIHFTKVKSILKRKIPMSNDDNERATKKVRIVEDLETNIKRVKRKYQALQDALEEWTKTNDPWTCIHLYDEVEEDDLAIVLNNFRHITRFVETVSADY